MHPTPVSSRWGVSFGKLPAVVPLHLIQTTRYVLYFVDCCSYLPRYLGR